MSLSDKRALSMQGNMYWEEDVKEFIRKFKEDIENGCGCYECGTTLTLSTLKELAGEKLI